MKSTKYRLLKFAFILFIILFSSIPLSGTTAPDELIISEGSCVKGKYNLNIEDEGHTFVINQSLTNTIGKTLVLQDVEKELLLINQTVERDSPTEISQVSKLVFIHNRTVLLPYARISFENESFAIEASVLEYDTFEEMNNINKTIITINNEYSYIYGEVEQTNPYFEEIVDFVRSLVFLKKIENAFQGKIVEVINPNVEIGDLVDYGLYTGLAEDFDILEVDSNPFNVIKVHINYTEVSKSIDGDVVIKTSYGMDAYYELESGLLVKFILYDQEGKQIGSFLPIRVNIEKEDQNTQSLTYPYILLGLNIICFLVLLEKKRRK